MSEPSSEITPRYYSFNCFLVEFKIYIIIQNLVFIILYFIKLYILEHSSTNAVIFQTATLFGYTIWTARKMPIVKKFKVL